MAEEEIKEVEEQEQQDEDSPAIFIRKVDVVISNGDEEEDAS